MISAANAVNDIPGEEGKHLKGYNIEAQNYDVIRKWYKMRGQEPLVQKALIMYGHWARQPGWEE